MLLFSNNHGQVHAENTEASPDYHENSSNNGSGTKRTNTAELGIGIFAQTSLASGYQDKDETYIPSWEAVPGDVIYLQPAIEIKNQHSFSKITFEIIFSDAISIDFNTKPSFMINNMGSFYDWDEIDYQYDQTANKLTFTVEPSDFNLDNHFQGSLSWIFHATINSMLSGDYSQIPINLRTIYTTTDGTEYVSGVTSMYTTEMNRSATETVQNLSSPGNTTASPGDQIGFTVDYQNQSTGNTPDTDPIQLKSLIANGFLYQPDTLKVIKTDSTAQTTDITDQVTLTQNDEQAYDLTLPSLANGESVQISYQGQVSPDYTGSTLGNTATLKSTTTQETMDVSAEIPITQWNNAVTVHYQDEQGQSLASDERLTGIPGTAYQTSAKSIDGYSLKETPANASGTFTDQPQTVTYIYTPTLAGDVTVHYQDEQGNDLAPDDTLTGAIGDSYQTTPKDIDGCSLKETPANASGTFTDQPQTVTYQYAKIPVIGTVTVSYQDQEGQPLADDIILSGNAGEPYQTQALDIPGYELVEIPANAKGLFSEKNQTVVYTYQSDFAPIDPEDHPTPHPHPNVTPLPPISEYSGTSSAVLSVATLPETGDTRDDWFVILGIAAIAGFVGFRKRL